MGTYITMNKILLIEDDAIIRFGISSFLKLKGFNVIEARNGEIGLQIAKEQLPNLILCDINMPKLDGYDVLQELRKDVRTANLPFIFISAETCTPSCRRALQLGANDFLTKPLNNRELLEAIAIQFN
ncbi:MAG: hypothetical protein Fur006_54740 [Coleofasciculaceae cyanobacterium]